MKLSGDKNYELFLVTIKSAGECGMPEFALEVYESAKIEGFFDDLRLFACIIEALGVVGYYNQLEEIYHTALTRVLEQEQEIIDESEALDKSRAEIEIQLTEYYFNHIHPIHIAAIKSMGKCGKTQAAIHIYKSLCEYWNGVYVDTEVYLNIIGVCIYNDDFLAALEIYKDMLNSDYRGSIDIHATMMTDVAKKNKKNVLDLIAIIAREILKGDDVVMNIVNFFLEEAYEIVKKNENKYEKVLLIDMPLSYRILQTKFSSSEAKATCEDATYHSSYIPQRRDSMIFSPELVVYDTGDEGDIEDTEDDNEELEYGVDHYPEFAVQQSHYSRAASTLFHQDAPVSLRISISPPTPLYTPKLSTNSGSR